jgi:two-component system chemotaxis sensor kinase CheA
MNDFSLPDDLPADEMAEYLRLYLDETEEQLDALVQALLALEADSRDPRQIDEAFRLLHSIKGSSALLGLDRITALTHHLESHFVQIRSGRRTLDAATMGVVLRCIDFLRACNGQLRAGEPLGSGTELLEQVRALEHGGDTTAAVRPTSPRPPAVPQSDGPAAGAGRRWRVEVHFLASLPLVELKAELVLARLAAVGRVLDSIPPRERLDQAADLTRIDVMIDTAAEPAALEAAANADGVDRVIVLSEPVGVESAGVESGGVEPAQPEPIPVAQSAVATSPPVVVVASLAPEVPPAAAKRDGDTDQRHAAAATAKPSGETLRIDVDRLDVLLNLAGELLVNRARIAELLAALGPLFRKSGHAGRSALVAESLRGIIHELGGAGGVEPAVMSAELEDAVELLRQQTDTWNAGRRTFGDLLAAVDQLTRVTRSLQHGVLSTRMVPVGPLFSRFRRSVRDIAGELGKKVTLEVTGEKTEIDKRMIDELGDPLNHLIRNSIDHGIEPADVRRRLGKPETARVRLSAAHRGNSVIITVADDGGGIDVERVRRKAVERGLVSPDKAAALDDADAINLIWEPGFSTKESVSAVSGRGVGMDIVRTKVRQLSGSVEVASVHGTGTTFTISLPLTLAITRCMLFQVPQAVFAAPIESVREIVRLADHRVVTVNGRELCDIRGEFLPLVGIEDLFRWGGAGRRAAGRDGAAGDNVVVLRSNARGFGLRVDALLGGQDLVVKPLDENYEHVQGLGGASILGDGSVCLLLDVATCIDLAMPQKGRPAATDAAAWAAGGGPFAP